VIYAGVVILLGILQFFVGFSPLKSASREEREIRQPPPTLTPGTFFLTEEAPNAIDVHFEEIGRRFGRQEFVVHVLLRGGCSAVRCAEHPDS